MSTTCVYSELMVKHLGRVFRCLAVFPNTPEGEQAANDFMERTPGASVLIVTDGIYLADKNDMGLSIKCQEKTS